MSHQRTGIGYDFETTSVDGRVYNVERLEAFAELLEAHDVPTEELREAVSEGHYYWEDRKGNKLGPYQLLQNWETAQQNEVWADHVATIQHADLTNPIWISASGYVFNGMHRLTAAFLSAQKTIRVKKFTELPKDAEVKEINQNAN